MRKKQKEKGDLVVHPLAVGGHLVHPLAVCGDGDECQDQAQSGRMQGDGESKWEWENAKSGRMQGD